MAVESNTTSLSRRLFVRALGLSAAGAAVPAAAIAAIPSPAPIGPLTPIEYVEEMLAARWRPVAAIDVRTERPTGIVFEFAPDDWDHRERANLSRSYDPNDAGFWPRVAQILFQRGMTDASHPRTREGWLLRKARDEFSRSLPERFTPATYIEFREERGWRFELVTYVDDDGDTLESTVEEISPPGYWKDKEADRRERIIQGRHDVSPSWFSALENELVKRGHRYVTRT